MQTVPNPGTVYRHTDGGIYRFVGMAKSSEDASDLVLYKHVWPFEVITWARPLSEWHSRFTNLSAAEFQAAVAVDRKTCIAAITRSKAERKAKPASVALGR